MNAARLEKVTKSYGRRSALQQVSFEIPKGAICALIGPNGAGKTTAMGVMAGLIRPQAGSVDLLGLGAFSLPTHAGRVGIMPQDSVPSPYASIEASLRFYGELQGLTRDDAALEATKWLGRVQLSDRARSKYGALSHGMRRRFSLAQAMLGTPELILLDEPTSGLDPELVVEIRRLIVALKGHSTVLVSSHVLSELEGMCDHAIFLEEGRCVRQGPMGTITGRDAVVRYRLSRSPKIPELERALNDCVVSWDHPFLVVRAGAGLTREDINAICLRILLDSGIGIQEVLAGDSLESAYMEFR